MLIEYPDPYFFFSRSDVPIEARNPAFIIAMLSPRISASSLILVQEHDISKMFKCDEGHYGH